MAAMGTYLGNVDGLPPELLNDPVFMRALLAARDPYQQIPEAEPGAARAVPVDPYLGDQEMAGPRYEPLPGPSPAKRKGPGFMERLKVVGPRMLNAAMDAIATPSVAGGGPVDIARAMQAAEQGALGRDMIAYNMRRQAEQRALAQREAEARIASQQARANYWEQRGRAPASAAKAYAVGTFGWYDTENKWHEAPKEKPKAETEKFPIDEPTAQRFGLKPDNEGKYFVPGSALGAYFSALSRPETGEKGPTEWSLAFAAAQGDKTAKQALDIVLKGRAPGGVDERQKRARVSAAWQRYAGELNEGEQQFSAAKRQLDAIAPGPDGKPRTLRSGETGPTGEEYENRLYDLETALQTKKNNTQGALEAVLQEFDVPHAPSRYLHPSLQRRKKPEPEPQAAPAAVPPPTAEARPMLTMPGSMGAIPGQQRPVVTAAKPEPQAPQVGGRQLAVGQYARLKNGRRVKIKKIYADGTFDPE